jgi:hypothetical protein
MELRKRGLCRNHRGAGAKVFDLAGILAIWRESDNNYLGTEIFNTFKTLKQFKRFK